MRTLNLRIPTGWLLPLAAVIVVATAATRASAQPRRPSAIAAAGGGLTDRSRPPCDGNPALPLPDVGLVRVGGWSDAAIDLVGGATADVAFDIAGLRSVASLEGVTAGAYRRFDLSAPLPLHLASGLEIGARPRLLLRTIEGYGTAVEGRVDLGWLAGVAEGVRLGGMVTDIGAADEITFAAGGGLDVDSLVAVDLTLNLSPLRRSTLSASIVARADSGCTFRIGLGLPTALGLGAAVDLDDYTIEIGTLWRPQFTLWSVALRLPTSGGRGHR